MKLPKILLALCLFGLMAGCKKKPASGTQPSTLLPPATSTPTSTVTTDTTRTYHRIDPALALYYNFKDGSSWEFSDSTGSKTETLYLQDYKVWWDQVKIVNGNTVHFDIYERVTYTLKSRSEPSYSYDLYFTISGNKIGFYTTLISETFARPYPFYYSPGSSRCSGQDFSSIALGSECKNDKDSVRLANGQKYLDVTSCLHYFEGIYQSFLGTSTPPIRTESIWSAGTGLVAFRSDLFQLNRQLKSSQVSPR